jgi:hypothetical protein
MHLTHLETAALRLAIARDDQAVKDAIEAFRSSLNERALMDALRYAYVLYMFVSSYICCRGSCASTEPVVVTAHLPSSAVPGQDVSTNAFALCRNVARDTISDTLAEQDAEEDDQGAQAGDHTAGRNQRSEVDEQSDDEDSQEQEDEEEGDDADEVGMRVLTVVKAPSVLCRSLSRASSHFLLTCWYYYQHQYGFDFDNVFAVLTSPGGRG